MKLSKLKPNPSNPRIIHDAKFDKLVKSIQNFPEMMEKRPMVCVTDKDGKLFPLGGNMRLRAIEKIGMKEIPDSWVTLADDWTEEKRKEFTIKDNVGFGEWDWEELGNSWDENKLIEWGLDLQNYDVIEEEDKLNSDLDKSLEMEENKPYLIVIFESDDEFNEAKDRLALKRVASIDKISEGLQRIVKWSQFI